MSLTDWPIHMPCVPACHAINLISLALETYVVMMKASSGDRDPSDESLPMLCWKWAFTPLRPYELMAMEEWSIGPLKILAFVVTSITGIRPFWHYSEWRSGQSKHGEEQGAAVTPRKEALHLYAWYRLMLNKEAYHHAVEELGSPRLCQATEGYADTLAGKRSVGVVKY